MALMQLHINSTVLGMYMDAWALIPEKLPEDGSKIKTLWFLHGGNGDHTGWVRRTGIEAEAERRGIAVICPGAHNSCYVNMHNWHNYNDYIGGELTEIVWNLFPVLSRERKDNMVAGFSNGGYGCFQIALSHPDKFEWACPAGAGDKADADWSYRPKDKQIVFGLDTDMKNSEYSLQVVANGLLKSGKPLPKLFHCCGEHDPWLNMNHIVRDYFQGLEGNPFEYSYHQIEGEGHSGKAMEISYTMFFDHIGLEVREKR